ncbi:MAG: hypothetical protein PHR09_01550 [Bacilli bacterium]|nr:hypothetical protein [Bacilli bacterium]
MKKKILIILLCEVMILGITGCDNNRKTEDKTDEKLLQCIESELGGYLVTEKDELIEIPLSEIKNNDKEKIAYYKGVYASNHPDNKYVIVYPKNGTYDFDVMKDFDKYFYEKFSIYQMSDISSITIYIHNQENDVDFKAIANKCVTKNNSKDSKSIPSKTLDKINNTTKIVMKFNQKELGIINDKDILTELLNAISSSEQYGDAFLCDGHGFDFEMYDSINKLIDTVYVWGDGKRLIPSSIHSGCSYYSISNDTDLRKIIEEETDYVFYNILDFRDNDKQKQQLIYKDNKYSYYLNSEDTNEILIKFMLNNQTMTLKYALNNNYISAEKVVSEYPDILIRK